MARGKKKYIKLVNSRRTRICFHKDVIYIHKKTPIKGVGNDVGQTIEVFPNYKIKESKISLTNNLPKNYTFNQNGIALRFHSNCTLFSNPAQVQELNNLSKYVVQLHFIEVVNERSDVSSGTGILIKINNKYMILSCLHTFVPDPNPENIQYHILVNNREKDLHNLLMYVVKGYTRSDESCSLLEYIRDESQDFWEVNMDRDFLNFRKEWLKKIQADKTYEKIIDPVSKMKPSPAFDISFLNVPTETVQSLINTGSQFLDLQENMSEVNQQNNRPTYLIAYNINEENEKDEQAQGNYDLQIKFYNFLYDGKSLSAGKCDKVENGFVVYRATTSEGSSGGPLFDEKGKLLGIAFGNLYDIESEQKKGGNVLDYDECFDIRYPGENLVQGSRNYNLAIAMDHPGLSDYLSLLDPEIGKILKKKENFPQKQEITIQEVVEKEFLDNYNLQQESEIERMDKLKISCHEILDINRIENAGIFSKSLLGKRQNHTIAEEKEEAIEKIIKKLKYF